MLKKSINHGRAFPLVPKVRLGERDEGKLQLPSMPFPTFPTKLNTLHRIRGGNAVWLPCLSYDARSRNLILKPSNFLFVVKFPLQVLKKNADIQNQSGCMEHIILMDKRAAG